MPDSRLEVFKGIDRQRLDDILTNITKKNIALIGDVCIDVYWRADMTKSELSRETPHFPLPVVEEWCSPGAGGNAAANIAGLRPNEIYVLGVLGRDWRGDLLRSELSKRNIDTSGIITSSKWITNAYCKPLRKGLSHVEYEDPRLDFCNYETLPDEDEEKLRDALREIAGKIDILCVSDQFAYGCITPVIRNEIINLAKQGLTVVVDSRDRIGLYTDVILKPNEVEGFKAVYNEGDPRQASFNDHVYIAGKLAASNNSYVCMTLGGNGSLFTDGDKFIHIPAHEVRPPIDICGAGDTFLSAFSCALAGGAEHYEAAAFANMASNVTIKKIGTTGTSSPEEIILRHEEISRL